jgi:hypothetical protein
MWQSNYPTAGLFMIHANVLKDGKVIGWSVSCPSPRPHATLFAT